MRQFIQRLSLCLNINLGVIALNSFRVVANNVSSYCYGVTGVFEYTDGEAEVRNKRMISYGLCFFASL